jgi:hypothetical protein
VRDLPKIARPERSQITFLKVSPEFFCSCHVLSPFLRGIVTLYI